MSMPYTERMKDAPDAFAGFFYLIIGLLLMGAATGAVFLAGYWIFRGIASLFS